MEEKLRERLIRIAEIVTEHLKNNGEDHWTTMAVLTVIGSEQIAVLDVIIEEISSLGCGKLSDQEYSDGYIDSRDEVLEMLTTAKEQLISTNAN